MAGNARVFNAAVSTGINALINITLYPLALFLIGVGGESANLFTSEGNLMIFLGIVIAIAEGIYRFKDELSSTVNQPRYGAAFYGWFLSLVATPVLIGLRSALVVTPTQARTTVPGSVDTAGAVYSDDVRERYRRYGMVNRVTEKANHYEVEIEFPRWVPNSVGKEEYNLPDRMPDYTYEIHLSSPYMPGEPPAPESVLNRSDAVG